MKKLWRSGIIISQNAIADPAMPDAEKERTRTKNFAEEEGQSLNSAKLRGLA